MKKSSFIVSFAVIAISLYAQLPPEFGRYKRVNTTNEKAQQDLIASVVENGAFIFSQSYQLEDSVGKFFGLSGNKEFGTDMSLAYKIKDGYIITNKSKEPWEYNNRFAKLKGRYNPVLFPSQYSELNSEARYDSIAYNANNLVTIYPNQLYAYKADTFFNEGFSVSHKEGLAQGYIIWFTYPADKDLNSFTQMNIMVTKQDIEVSSDRSKEYEINIPSNNEIVMGGIYVVPEITGIGTLQFVLYGVAVNNNDGWKLICPFSKDENIFLSSPVVQKTNDEVDELMLTPNDK